MANHRPGCKTLIGDCVAAYAGSSALAGKLWLAHRRGPSHLPL